MTYRVRNIGIAVALAAVAALLTSFYVTNYKRHVQRGEDHVTVLVAKHDIPTGTPGSDAAHMMSTQEVPRRSVAPGAISSPDEIKNMYAAQTTFAGEQVTTRRFSAVRQDSIRAQLHGTMRAYQIQGDQNQLLAGTLRTGDHVDLVAAIDEKPGEVWSRTVLRNLDVLRAPNAPAAGSKLTSGLDANFSTLLAMTDNQVQKFQWILERTKDSSNGAGWHLTLRPVTHDADSANHVDNLFKVYLGDLNGATRRAALGGR